MTFLDWFNISAMATQSTSQIIKIVELGSAPGSGPQKKQVVIDTMVSTLKLAAIGTQPLTPRELKAYAAFIDSLTDSLVLSYNKSGQFQRNNVETLVAAQ